MNLACVCQGNPSFTDTDRKPTTAPAGTEPASHRSEQCSRQRGDYHKAPGARASAAAGWAASSEGVSVNPVLLRVGLGVETLDPSPKRRRGVSRGRQAFPHKTPLDPSRPVAWAPASVQEPTQILRRTPRRVLLWIGLYSTDKLHRVLRFARKVAASWAFAKT